jgi:hypothetical protein
MDHADARRQCRVIGLYHLDRDSLRFLEGSIKSGLARRASFDIFHVSDSAIGLKLAGIPWGTGPMRYFGNITDDGLRQAHLDCGIPPSLVNVLHLAGEADVRYLIFDADAPEIEGLPIYDD